MLFVYICASYNGYQLAMHCLCSCDVTGTAGDVKKLTWFKYFFMNYLMIHLESKHVAMQNAFH